MRLLVSLLVWTLRAVLKSRRCLALENLALRHQLATYARSQKRPRLKPEERAFWVALSRVWGGWRSPLAFVKPATVIAWHRRGFRRYWRWRSRKQRGKKGRRYRCHLDLWLADVMGIEGIPIPYRAPNASPHIERFNRTLRQEALDYSIFLNVKHVRRVCAEYRDFYNRGRPSQALHAIPDPYSELKKPPPASGTVVALPVLGGYSATIAARRRRQIGSLACGRSLMATVLAGPATEGSAQKVEREASDVLRLGGSRAGPAAQRRVGVWRGDRVPPWRG